MGFSHERFSDQEACASSSAVAAPQQFLWDHRVAVQSFQDPGSWEESEESFGGQQGVSSRREKGSILNQYFLVI